MVRISRLAALVILAGAVLASGCVGRRIDLAAALEMIDINSGWYDAGIVDRTKNKLVPTISFRLRNKAAEQIPGVVQLNAVFRRVGEGEEWGSAFVRAVDSRGLEAGAVTEPIVLRSTLGYTGEEPRSQLLENRLFVDAQVQVFAKHGSSQWTSLGDHKIQRQLLTR
jgi:hypothetical protein